jgi:hypothetical protein
VVERSAAVMAANVAARTAFAAQDGEAYAPHISLAYADAPPSAFEAMRTEAERAGVGGLRFAARTLELWRTTGPVADWRLQASFPMRAFGAGGA